MRSLKTRVTAFTLAVFVISVWSLALYVSAMLRASMQHTLGEQQLSTVSFVGAQINQELKARMDALELIAGAVDAPLLDQPEALQKYVEARPILQQLFNAGVFVTRLDGTAVAEAPRIGRVGLNYLDRDHVAAALKEGKATVGKPVIGKRVVSPSFAITVPVRDPRRGVIGALSGATDMARPSFLDDVAESRYGSSGGYLIVDPEHQLFIAASSNKRLVMQPLPAPGVNRVFDRRLQGFDGPEVNVNSLGVEVLTSAARIPAAGWFVIATLPTAEAFAPIDDMRQRVLVAALLLTAFAGGLTWWMLRRELAPISTTAKALAARSDTGEPPQPLPVARDDEIGDLIGGFNRLLEALAERGARLKASEGRFKVMFDEAPLGIALVDSLTGRIQSANPMFARIAGRPMEELSTIDWMSITHPDDVGQDLDNMALLNAGKIRGFGMDKRYLRPDGSIVWISMTIAPIVGDDKARPSHVCMIEEVTARKESEDATRAASQYARSLIEASLDPLVTISSEGKITDVNTATERATGADRSALIGSDFADYFTEPEKAREGYRKVFSQGFVTDYPLAIRHASGKVTDVLYNASVYRDAAGNALGVFAAARDITERKRVEEELAGYIRRLSASEDRLSAMFALSKNANGLDERELLQMGLEEAVRLTGSEIGYLHLVNDDQENLQLVTWSAATSKHCTAVHDDHYSVSSAGVWADSIRFHRPVVHNDYQTLTGRKGYPEGHAHLVRHLGIPVIENEKVRVLMGVGNKPADYEASDVEQLQLIGNDVWSIVMRRRAERALVEAKDAAEAANRAKSIFLANMSHELRTPLNGMMGMTDLALRRASDAKQIDQLNKSRHAAQHLLAVINDILDISKIEADRLPLEENPFSLAQVIDDVLGMQGALCELKGLGLSREIAPTLPDLLLGDAFRLRQILLNFVGNAIKFSERGPISVHAYAEEQDSRSVLLRIEVTDHGIGISPEQQARLFRAFTQADGSMTRRYGGAGLGLIIAKRLALLMGGDVGVVSEAGSGSTFWVTVRCRRAVAVPPPGPAGQADSNGASRPA